MEEVVPPSLNGNDYPVQPPHVGADMGNAVPMHEPLPVYDDYGAVTDPDCFTDAPMSDLDYPAGSVCCDEGPAPIYSTGTWYWRGNWYTQMDFVYMVREEPRKVLVISEPGVALYDQTDLVTQRYQPGARVTVGRFLGRDAAGRDHLLNMSFLGALSWSSDRRLDSVNPNGGTLDTLLALPNSFDFFAPFFNSDTQTYSYSTDFNNLAVNYRIQARPGRDVLAMQPNGAWVRHGLSSRVRAMFVGLRGSSLNEEVDYRSATAGFRQSVLTQNFDDMNNLIDSNTDMLGQQNDLIRGAYVVRTNNDMLGIHFGTELIEKYDEWSWGFRGKIGGLANFVQRRSNVTGVNREAMIDTVDVQRTDGMGNPLFLDNLGNLTTSPTRPDGMGGTIDNDVALLQTITTTTQSGVISSASMNSSDEFFTFDAEVGLFATYQLRPNLHFKAGYDFIFLTGVALASENMEFVNGFPMLNPRGSIVMHGGSVGFETTW